MTVNKLVTDARAIYDAALEGVRPDRLVARWLEDRGEAVMPPPGGRIGILAVGKAALGMAAAAEAALAGHPLEGLAIVPHGYRATVAAGRPVPTRVEVIEAGHPVPDAAGAQAAARLLSLAERFGPQDCLLALISGGGSALLPLFAPGITLEDARHTFDLLLRSGAPIGAFNTVRKHLSRLGGGRLAVAAAPARLVTLVISDVPGDDLATVASGPTVADPTTFAEAQAVLKHYRLWDATPAAVRAHLERGMTDPARETPKPDDPRLAEARTHLLAGNRDALEAAAGHARTLGYEAVILDEPLTGEAREAGRRLGQQVRTYPAPRPACLIWGGETTVTVRGAGRGGRNQEVALGAAAVLEGAGRPLAVLAGGTDGIDGPTDAAGACITPATAADARRRGLSLDQALARNDAYPLLDALGALLRPGPTHTNVMDLAIGLIAPK